MVITMAKLCMAHARTHGARKPPGPIIKYYVGTGQAFMGPVPTKVIHIFVTLNLYYTSLFLLPNTLSLMSLYLQDIIPFYILFSEKLSDLLDNEIK